MTKRADPKSTKRQIEAFSAAAKEVEPPEGIVLKSEEERVLWRQFTRTRAAVDWRLGDLVMLYKVVSLETKIREIHTAIDEQGLIVENKRGTQIKNPLLDALQLYQANQLQVYRALKLTEMASDPRTIKKQAQVEDAARRIAEEDGEDSLFASPVN